VYVRVYSIIESGFRFHTESRFRFSEKVHSNNESESGFRFGETCLQIRYMPTDLKSFDLPSESETRFSVNPNPDSIIEYALSFRSPERCFWSGWGSFLVDTYGVFLQAVYGVLSAIEGCDAFSDLVARTDISRWYHAVKSAVAVNAGERQAVATENQLHATAWLLTVVEQN